MRERRRYTASIEGLEERTYLTCIPSGPDPNDQTCEAQRIGRIEDAQIITGNLSDGQDVDMYELQLDRGDKIRISTDRDSIDVGLRLFAEFRNAVRSIEEVFLRNGEFTATQSGPVYLGISEKSNCCYGPESGRVDFHGPFPEIGDYSVTISSDPDVGSPEIIVTWTSGLLGTREIIDGLGDPTGGLVDATDLGTVIQGAAPIDRTFTVRNDGNSALTLGQVTVPAGFSVVDRFNTTIAPGSSDTFTIRLDSNLVGAKQGELSFATNDPDENPFNFSISGVVQDNLQVGECISSGPDPNDQTCEAIVGGTIEDGKTLAGSISDGLDVDMFVFDVIQGERLRFDLDVDSIRVGIRLFSEFDNAVGSIEEILIRNNEYTADRTGELFIGISETFNCCYNPESGRGDLTSPTPELGNYSVTVLPAASPEISVSRQGVDISDGHATPNFLNGTDFGVLEQGDDPVHQTFTVHNNGDAMLTLGQIMVPDGFSIVEALNTSIPPNSSDSFTIRLNSDFVGVMRGNVSFFTNDADENPFNFAITGWVKPQPLGIIRGYIWNDSNGNGEIDGSEKGIPQREVFLDKNGNLLRENDEIMTVTDETGRYEFTNLAEGSYSVVQILPDGWLQTLPVPMSEELIADGGFELGFPNQYWQSSSLLFDSPICNAECSVDGISNAFDGEWFVWFGGALGENDSAYVEQTVQFATNENATLRFQLFADALEDHTEDTFRVLVGENVVFNLESDEFEDFNEYKQVEIELSSDGKPHVLRLESDTKDGSFFVDNVSIQTDSKTAQELTLSDGETLDSVNFGSRGICSIGDVNRDGIFNSTDLVTIFQAGKYEQPSFASCSEGDWNLDGRFDSTDLVLAFQAGSYVAEAISNELAVALNAEHRLQHQHHRGLIRGKALAAF